MSAGVNLWDRAEHAEDYLERRKTFPHRMEGYGALREQVPASTRRILDLGTGDGEVLAVLRADFPNAAMVGVDFSPTMLDLARRRFAGDASIEVVEHNLEALLPALGRFDAVVSAFAIHHVDDDRKRALYAEVFDALEPGGVFCNLEHVSSPTAALHERFLYAIGSRPEDDDPSNKLLDVVTQLRWLRELGFENVDCHWKWLEMALLVGEKP